MLQRKYYKMLWMKEEAGESTIPGGENQKEASEEWLCRERDMNLGWILKVEEFTNWEGPPWAEETVFRNKKV